MSRASWISGVCAILGIFGWFCLLSCTLERAGGQQSAPSARRMELPRREVDRWLKDQIRLSGGDVNSQRYHFVLGFSTGHFGKDPDSAEAARQLAFSLLNNTFAAGDQVTPLAWEMTVWKIGDTTLLTQDPATRAHFVEETPRTPAYNTIGGHDVEQALYTSLEKVTPRTPPATTIILLVTNTNHSQAPLPPNQRLPLFGENNPQLAQAIAQHGYRPHSLAEFTVKKNQQPIAVDITALFPVKLKGLPDHPVDARYPTFPVSTFQPPDLMPMEKETLPNQTQPDRKSGGLFSGLLPLLLATVMIVAVLLALSRMRTSPTAKTDTAPSSGGKSLPGSIHLEIGDAPHTVREILPHLSTTSKWTLRKLENGLPELSSQVSPSDTILAQIQLNNRGELSLDALGEWVFQDVQGLEPHPTHLALSVQDRSRNMVVCRIASTLVESPSLRLELRYLNS